MALYAGEAATGTVLPSAAVTREGPIRHAKPKSSCFTSIGTLQKGSKCSKVKKTVLRLSSSEISAKMHYR